jgi:hypothetical protein
VCLAKRWHWERKSVKSFLEALKADLMLSTVTVTAGDTPYTLITISNYDKFQADIEEPTDTAADARWEALGTRSSPKNGHGDGHGDSPDKSLKLQQLPLTDKEGNGYGDGRPRDTRTDTKVKNIRSNKKPSVFWSDFILQFTSEDKAVLTNTLSAISSTRKSGRIAENVQNGIAGRLSSFPQSVVLAGCRTYLQKNYAAEGKNENYLIGIIRNLSNKGSHPVQPAKTPGQIAIDAAARELLEV